jgi:hypothetical protein
VSGALARVSGRRILLVDYHLLVDDVSAVLTGAGAHVRRLYPATLSVDTFKHTCREHRPHVVLSVNHAPPLAFLCSLVGVPYVSWSIDPLPLGREQVLPGTKPELCLCFVHRRRLVQRLLAAGLPRVDYLPLAAAARRVIPPEQAPAGDGEVTFVGGSLASDDVVLEQWMVTAGWEASLRERVDAWLGELLATRGDDPEFMGLAAEPAPPEWLDEQVPRGAWPKLAEALDGRLGYWHRRRVIQSLSDHGLVVYGDAGWAPIARDYRGLAHNGDALTRIYRSSLCNLDVPRLYQREIVTLRAFDVMATGGLLLTEAAGELAALVSPDAYLEYQGLPHLAEQITLARDNPADMREMARAAQRQVSLAHRLEHRVERIVRECERLGWL